MSLASFYALPADEVEDWIADDDLERDKCRFHGGPASECGDDERDWFPQLVVCQPTMQLAAANRRYEELHKEKPFHTGGRDFWAKEPSDQFPYHYADGASIFLVPDHDLGLGGDFLEQGLEPAQEGGEAVESED